MLNSQIGRQWKKLNFLIRHAAFQPPCCLRQVPGDKQGGKLAGCAGEASVAPAPCKATGALTKERGVFSASRCNFHVVTAGMSQEACGCRAFKRKGLSSVNNTAAKSVVYTTPEYVRL